MTWKNVGHASDVHSKQKLWLFMIGMGPKLASSTHILFTLPVIRDENFHWKLAARNSCESSKMTTF